MLQRLAACTVQELGSQEVPGLINGLAGAIAMERARIDGSLAEGHQDLQAAAMQGAVALVVQVTAWLLREEGQLLSLGPEATCTPVTEVGRGAVGSEIALCRGNCHIGTQFFQISNSVCQPPQVLEQALALCHAAIHGER